MKNYRVTIAYQDGEQNGLISTTVPAIGGDKAMDSVIEANGLDGKVIEKKAELIKTK